MKKLIAFEGIDEVGKTTTVEKIAFKLNEAGKKTKIIADPYDYPEKITKEINNLFKKINIKNEALRYILQREAIYNIHLSPNVIHDVEYILFDRTYFSTMAYQDIDDCPNKLKYDVLYFFIPKDFNRFRTERLENFDYNDIDRLFIVNERYKKIALKTSIKKTIMLNPLNFNLEKDILKKI